MTAGQPPARHASQPPDLRALPPRSNDAVLLRPWQRTDLPTIAEASTDPYIALITMIPAPYTPHEGAAWLQRQHDQAAEGRGCPLAVVSRSTRDVVGSAIITGIDWHHRRASIGYWLLARHRGHGYARAAVALLPGLASDLGLVRIEAQIEPGNHASQAVCRSLGFTEEGTLRAWYRIGDDNRDVILFARLLPPYGPPP
jgi:[ribosomal protein S5]-alanine N-acetyltransferase